MEKQKVIAIAFWYNDDLEVLFECVDNTTAKKVLGISTPDHTFYHEYISQERIEEYFESVEVEYNGNNVFDWKDIIKAFIIDQCKEPESKLHTIKVCEKIASLYVDTIGHNYQYNV